MGSARGVSTKKALAFVYVGYAFRYLYLLVLVPFYGRVLGAAEYGRVLAAMSLYQMVWMITEYGFPSAGLRDIAIENTPQRVAQIYGRHTSGRILMTAVAALVGLVGTLASPLLRERPIFGIFATLSGITAAFNMGWYFQGILRFRTSVLVEILGFSINIALVLLLVHRRQDSYLVLAALWLSSSIATGVAHAIAHRSMDGVRVHWPDGLVLIRESTALFAARGLALMMSSSSTLLISLFASAREVGWYGAAERLATAALSLMLPANQVLIGTVASLIASKDTELAAYGLIRRGLFMLTGAGLALLVSTLLLAGMLTPLLLGPEFVPSADILRILSVMFPFAAFAQVTTGYVLVPLRYDRLVSAVSLVGAVATVSMTVVLGRFAGGQGVACARALGYVSMCGMLIFILRREHLLSRIFGR
jgi:PST family polysaccharide transporter